MSPDEVSNQIRYGKVPQDWMMFQPPPYPRAKFIFYSIVYIIMLPLECAVFSGLLMWWLQPELVQSSPWPMYATYPLLAVIALSSPFFIIWLVWWLEKRDRDIFLVLLPDGFIQYKPWNDMRKRHAHAIKYANIEAITFKNKLAGIILNINNKDGHGEKVFISRKYDDPSQTTSHEQIVQQIISSQRSLSTQDPFHW